MYCSKSILVTDGFSALSGPVRRAGGHTVLRDDFTSSSINTAYWKYEVSAYGGYVSIENIMSLAYIEIYKLRLRI